MYELLFKEIVKRVPLTETEFEHCKPLFQPKKLRKKRLLFGEGEVCRSIAFVEKGLLRTYVIDEKGAEHNLQFASEGWWVEDLSSFLTGEVSKFNIEALEDSELLIIDKASWEALLEQTPLMERYFRILLENALIATQKRLISAFSESASERYLGLIDHLPDLLQRVPQHMIASYLGITRETLSRVRGQLASKRI